VFVKNAVEQWFAESRTKLKAGTLEENDLDHLECLLKRPRQLILYLTARSTNPRSGVVGWALYDPTADREPTLPSNEPPYSSPLDAVTDGWRIVQFPVSKLYEYKDIENDYVGFDFILEKWI
jgi:hypothetical protein